MGTREDFRKELTKLGFDYLGYSVSNRCRKDGAIYEQKMGNYELSLDVWPDKYKVKWEFEAFAKVPKLPGAIGETIPTGFKRKGRTYDIAELIQAYREFYVYLEQKFIPKMAEYFRVPEKLEALLLKEK
jgi:hypothetical protein